MMTPQHLEPTIQDMMQPQVLTLFPEIQLPFQLLPQLPQQILQRLFQLQVHMRNQFLISPFMFLRLRKQHLKLHPVIP